MLHVDVKASVAGISLHVTPRVVGVIVGAAQFDIWGQRLLLVPVLVATAKLSGLQGKKKTHTQKKDQE